MKKISFQNENENEKENEGGPEPCGKNIDRSAIKVTTKDEKETKPELPMLRPKYMIRDYPDMPAAGRARTIPISCVR